MLNAEEGVLTMSEVARMSLDVCSSSSIAFKHDLQPGLAFTVYGGCKHFYAATAALWKPLPSA